MILPKLKSGDGNSLIKIILAINSQMAEN